MQISTIHSFCLEYLKTKDEFLNLLDDDTSEKKALFIQKFKEKLGFKDYSTLLDYQIPAVIDKFGEYTCFNVDTEELIGHIRNTRPVSQDYIDFINELDFFSKKRVDDNDFKDDWYNARYLRVAEAYPKYLELLDEHGYVDYDTLQLKALRELQKNPETQYKCILVDEFQDTDPLQFRIFNILRKNADYFTAVGDVDQHIYAFRSSFTDYFRELSKDSETEIISLDYNYRSTKDIVRISDDFIKHQRDEYSQKHLKSANDDYDNCTFIMESESNSEEADKILNTIKYLKESGKINSYNEIAVLYRRHSNKTITELINLFYENGINFTIKGQADLKDQDEVKSIMTMLWYVTRKTNPGHIPSNDELDKMNLKAFCGEYFEPAFWSLVESTKSYLADLYDTYLDRIVEVENEIRQSQGRRNVKSAKNVKKNEDLDTLVEIFKKVETPVVDISKITDENDRKFFEKLEDLRQRINSIEPPKILEVYYELLSFGDYMADIETNEIGAKNLAVLTQSIYNYESFISSTDVKGLFYFLNGVIRNYGSNYPDESGVQLMTVHAAKGLEFPVTIVSSLEKDKFPMKPKDPEHKKNVIFMKDTFYTPNEFLKFKNISLEEENELDMKEEERIIYVAMTRAADLLILSCVNEIPNCISKIRESLHELNSTDDLSGITIKKHDIVNEKDEKLKLNYSSYSTYNLCPHMYNLIYNLGFRLSDENVTNLGTVFHEVMEAVNLKLKDKQKITNEELLSITEDVYSSMFDIDETPEEYSQLKSSVLNYFETYSQNVDVVESELPFEIERDNYTLNGAIDLVYRISDTEIGILDYKNAEHDDNKIRHYEKQLYIYASALKELPEFRDFEIRKGITHFVKTDYKHEVEITDEKIRKQLDKLHETASRIDDKEFPKNRTNFCEYCKFRIIC